MKMFDVIVAVLLVLGGLNWGTVGLFDLNMVSYFFGATSFVSKVIYLVIGTSAVYQAVLWKDIQNRWKG